MFISNHTAFWSASPSQEESHYRIIHQPRTKRRGKQRQQQQQQQEKRQVQQEQQQQQQRQQHEKQQRQQQQWERLHYLEKWTWEEILDGKGPWEQPGDYCRPKAELEAAKAERRHYEELARQSGWKPESQPQKFIGGGLTGSMATPGRRPAQTSCAYRGARDRAGTMLCYGAHGVSSAGA